MNDRIIVLSVIALIIILIVVVAKWILKLPSKYDRRPQVQSPWNSLDSGIDPSISDSNQL